ncbi:uncharacterized protein LOC131649883 [Vicia villosa]|uniref:uncharacterized protein LOC131649883 n=1 Tax=Vicia villosa TaxID=3911 RepID=UPI00273C7567|nr:uncharacterized protein LOC131649883 [Vicia villosa]
MENTSFLFLKIAQNPSSSKSPENDNPKNRDKSKQTALPNAQTNPNYTKTKTFANVVSNVCNIPQSQFPVPCLKGDRITITISEEEYKIGLQACRHNLHGRIVWPRGSTPTTVASIRTTLLSQWSFLSKWGITSLGKGFYEFSFSNLEDARRVRSVNTWNLNPGTLKLFPWTKDFVPSNVNLTSAQVWVRIHGLSQEYWRPNIIFAIASSLGTPICIDSTSSKPAFDRSFGHFVRVLVDRELAKDLIYKILVERIGFAFFVEVEYEKLP